MQKIAFFWKRLKHQEEASPSASERFSRTPTSLPPQLGMRGALRLIREIESRSRRRGAVALPRSLARTQPGAAQDATRVRLARGMVSADAVELELAAIVRTWLTRASPIRGQRRNRRKPDKAKLRASR